MRKFLAYSSLSLFLVSLMALPAKPGSEPVSNPDSSTGGDTFGPNNIVGLIQRLIGPIRGAVASVSGNGQVITITVPQEQIQVVLERFRGQVRLQIGRYSPDDVGTLELLAQEATLGDVLQQALNTLQQTDPARAARIQVLITRLNQLLAALNANSVLPSEQRLLVAANLEAISGELRATDSASAPWLVAQGSPEAGDAGAPQVVYEPVPASEVVAAVEEHNTTVKSLDDEDAVALASNTSFVVVADILEQIAAEFRGEPIPDENLAPIDDIIASLTRT